MTATADCLSDSGKLEILRNAMFGMYDEDSESEDKDAPTPDDSRQMSAMEWDLWRDSTEQTRDARGRFEPTESDDNQQVRVSKNGKVWVRAKTDGEVSPLDGESYQAGQWMPVYQLPTDAESTTQLGQATDSEPSGHWITIGGHEGESGEHHGGTPVFIGRGGKILKGPVGLRGENVKSLDKNREAMQARQAHATALGKTARDITEQEARKLGSKAHIEAHYHAKQHAKQYGVSTHDVLQNMHEAHKYLLNQHALREHAKDRARQLTGLNAGNLARIENTYRDYSTVPNFDTTARTIAAEHPELGLHPDDSGTAPAIWSLIREGKIEPPKFHGPETARQSAEWVDHARKAHRDLKSDHDDAEDTSFDFGFGRDEMGQGASPFVDFSQMTQSGDE